MKNSVLVVDDDPATLQLIGSVLEAHGVSCLLADGGVQALQLANAHPGLRLIVTDINMPEMDGLALVSRIGETLGRSAALPVIFLTAYPSVDFAISALRLGATDFLIKPVRPVQLLALVKRVIGESQEGMDQQSLKLLQPVAATSPRPAKRNDVSGRALLGIDELRNRRRAHPLLSELDDTACDLLLELLRAERAARRLSVSALSISIDNGRVSCATALRRIQNLVRAGLIVRVPDPLDARREFVSLASETRVALELYLTQVAEAFAVAANVP